VVRALLGGKIGSVMRNARVVLAGNAYLADFAVRSGARRVEPLPTVVDLDRYPPHDEQPHEPAADRPFTVGWIGTPVTARYLDLVEGPLRDLHRRRPLQVRLIGADARALAGSGLPVERVPWSENGEAAAIAGCDVGIMPLPDAPWERGKCGYKLIQYAACGLPVVASPVGVNTEIIDDGVSGVLASGGPDWTRALGALQDDPGLRRRMGAAGRARVENRYSVQVAAPRLAALLRAAAAGGPVEHVEREVKQGAETDVRPLRVS
jgi:glycosyltransferase involved in cell wall biosynthesis